MTAKTFLVGTAGLLAGVGLERLGFRPWSHPDSVSAASPMNNNALEPYLSPSAARVGEIMKFGFPSMDTIRSGRDYIISYDRRNRTPNWVFEHLTPQSVKKNDAVDRNLCDFKEDKSIHPYFRSQNSDYKYSGFDRGHLAAAGNHRQSQEHVDETFYLSNMSPQVGVGFNRDKWEHLERYVRKLAKKCPNVYICTGPLYLPHLESDGKTYVKYQVLGRSNVAVPTHFFKIVVSESPERNQTYDLESFVLPNQRIDDAVPLSSFYVPPDSVERASGLLFFDRLPRDQLRSVNGQAFKG
uniref:Endonuclease n=2 Tax=Caligus rogercresseyi TaxID=217165 RepID=C1BR61_CALRO|nr:Endonuclease G, mitochondrial precursor [Caligus rogercresseyi]